MKTIQEIESARHGKESEEEGAFKIISRFPALGNEQLIVPFMKIENSEEIAAWGRKIIHIICTCWILSACEIQVKKNNNNSAIDYESRVRVVWIYIGKLSVHV